VTESRSSEPEIVVCANPRAAAETAAGRFVAAVDAAFARANRAAVALSGGSTPRELYALLAVPPWRERVDWSRVHVFLVDERWVPITSPESNAGMILRTLLAPAAVPTGNIHFYDITSLDVGGAALEYERTLREVAGDPPRLDVVLLGLGEDAHTASLFPGSGALAPSARLVVPAVSMQVATRQRLTLTPTAINAARAILFFVTGEKKAAAVHAVLRGPRSPLRYPGQIVRPTDGTITWILDRAAAAELATDGSVDVRA
jgi:6-phosphogluconolactonase